MSRRKIFELFGSIVIEGTGANKKAMTELQKDIRATNKTLNKMGKDAAKVGGLITKGLTVPLLGVGAAITKVGADFDEAMTNSLAIMGDVSDAMRGDMEKVAREVAKDLNISVTSMGEAYFFLASAGLDAAQSMAALPKVAAFAKAGNFDLARATDLLTDSQSALGLSSDDTAEHMENMVMVSDMLIQANKNANASAEQFSEALTNKAGVALNLLNKEMSEGLAVLQVYADKGLAKGADAGTQLNIVLRDLQVAAVNNKQAFEAAGVSVFDADGKMLHIADIVEDLTGRLGGMSDEQKRGELLMLGFTSKSIDATSALLGTSEAIREYEKDLKSAGGVTQEVAEKQLKSFWEQVGLAKTAIIDLGLTLFDKLQPILEDHILPAINKITESLRILFEWFEKHPIISDFVATFVTALAVMGPLLLTFAKFIPLIKSVFALYKALTAAQITLNAVMAANPIGLIVVGIGLLIAAGVALYKNWDVVKDKFVDVWDSIKYHFENITSTIAVLYGSMILGILEGINKVGKYIPGLNKGLDSLIKTVQGGVDVLTAEIIARKAVHKEQQLSKQLTKEEEKVIKAATAATVENGEVAEEVAAKKKIATLDELEEKKRAAEEALKFERDAARQSFEIQKKLFKEKEKLEEDGVEKVKRATAQKLLENEFEKNEAIRIATEEGMETAALEALFQAQADVIKAEAKVKENELKESEKEVEIKERADKLGVVTEFASSLNAIWSASLNKRSNELDSEAEKERKRINNSLMSEDEKATAIAKIDEELEAKKKKLQRENAIREKAMTLFSIGVRTAQAVMTALTAGPFAGPPLAIAAGILGAVQLGVVAATPLPLAKGGLIRSDGSGTGIVAEVGEGREDEIVLPMKTGANELAKNIFGKMKGFGSDFSINTRSKATEVHNHYHIGTLIADEFGIKKFAKKVNKYTIAENQRTGVAGA